MLWLIKILMQVTVLLKPLSNSEYAFLLFEACISKFVP
jgi:hypothetical protein